MAIASVGNLGTGASSTNGSTLTMTTAAALEAGNVGILVVSADNTSPIDGDNGEVTGVSDPGGAWSKLGEFTNSNAVAGAGVTCSVWMRRPASTLASGSTVTVTFDSNRTDKCCTAWEFSAAAGLAVVQTVTNGTDGASG